MDITGKRPSFEGFAVLQGCSIRPISIHRSYEAAEEAANSLFDELGHLVSVRIAPITLFVGKDMP